MRFVDTNVLLYSISTDRDEAEKAKRANELLGERDLAVSVQVLGEFYVQATRASQPDAISHAQAVRLIESFGRYPVVSVTLDTVHAALAARRRFGLSYWDAAIIEAARAIGCRTVLSEDMSHGRDYDGVTVVDPFRNGGGA